jgi:DNA replication protein DnaC
MDAIRSGLASLHLPEMLKAFDEALANPSQEQDRMRWFWQLLEPEVIVRSEKRIERRIREARFPARKTMEGFDFGFQPNLDRQLLRELVTLRFMERGANILLAGMSGTGKSHLAIALGLAACAATKRVFYTTSEGMLTKLNASLADGSLHSAMLPYLSCDLLVIDEVGLEQAERTLAARSGLMQKVLFPRYEHCRSTIITSNIPWEAWGTYLGDELGAAAIIDRLIHRSHVITINGPSYREHEHRQDLANKVAH